MLEAGDSLMVWLRGGALLLSMLISSPSTSVAQSLSGDGSNGGADGTHVFHDPTYKISFDYPANWSFTKTDREISTFRLDARSAPRNASMRAVAAMPENPFPRSTFSGAYLYFSVTPRSSESACGKQAAPPAKAKMAKASRKPAKVTIADIPFMHGHDDQREICIVQRDEIYTTLHHGACYRFDLAINNFCGGQVSGVKDITERELDQVRTRLESIMSTVRFDPK
jgi:hypothetical protein